MTCTHMYKSPWFSAAEGGIVCGKERKRLQSPFRDISSPGDGQYAGVHRTQKSHSVAELGIFHFIPQSTHTDETHVLSSFSCLFYASSVVKFKQYTVHFNCLIPVVCWHAQTYPHARVPPATCTSVYNPLIPTVAILVHLWSIMCYTGLSCHL